MGVGGGVGALPGHLQQVMERLALKRKGRVDGCRTVVVGETGRFLFPRSQTCRVTVFDVLYSIIYFLFIFDMCLGFLYLRGKNCSSSVGKQMINWQVDRY